MAFTNSKSKNNTVYKKPKPSVLIDLCNEFNSLNEHIKMIPLTKNQTTLVDTSDWLVLKDFIWFASTPTKESTRYTASRVIRKICTNEQVSMSKVIWELHREKVPSSMKVGHIDGDSLNNRLSNLVLVSRLARV